jgi:hypothetical protein
MRSSSFKIIIQVQIDPGLFYIIPGEYGFLRADGFYIWLMNISSTLRGIIHMASYSGAGTSMCKCEAIGSCCYILPDPRSHNPRHPVLIDAQLLSRAGNEPLGLGTSGTATAALTRGVTNNPATSSQTDGNSVSQGVNYAPGGLGGSTTLGTNWGSTRTNPSRTTSESEQNSNTSGWQMNAATRETRVPLKVFRMAQNLQ